MVKAGQQAQEWADKSGAPYIVFRLRSGEGFGAVAVSQFDPKLYVAIETVLPNSWRQ
jgi:hypothetical protein